MVKGRASVLVWGMGLAEEIFMLIRKEESWGGYFGGNEGHLHRIREKRKGISQIPEGFGWSS